MDKCSCNSRTDFVGDADDFSDEPNFNIVCYINTANKNTFLGGSMYSNEWPSTVVLCCVGK